VCFSAGNKGGEVSVVIDKSYFERQAAALFKLSQSTQDPELAVALIKKAADLKSQADELSPPLDQGLRAPERPV
jgi:hypothetical protein